jgi:hypothetical protein
MAWPIPTVGEVAAFAGRPLADYPAPYSDQAIIQAVVMFRFCTELTDPPLDPDDAQLALFGILQYAEVTILEQPYFAVTHNPFQSQTMGGASYSKPVSYSRGNAQANALKGEQTGVLWFDLAVAQLALRTQRGGVFVGTTTLNMNDGLVVRTDEITGEKILLGPSEVNLENQLWFDWNGDSGADSNSGGAGQGMRG